MRGSRADGGAGSAGQRSIPAHAGKPLWRRALSPTRKVDPRACGEAASSHYTEEGLLGRSPRMRGSLVGEKKRVVLEWSIPAHAGKPSSSMPRIRVIRVDPRACGEAIVAAGIVSDSEGRSPRMRGSQYWMPSAPGSMGSIPAHAGKPRARSRTRDRRRVDPRACGEAGKDYFQVDVFEGRSPRMRGSPIILQIVGRAWGSIPAHAGKPLVAN